MPLFVAGAAGWGMGESVTCDAAQGSGRTVLANLPREVLALVNRILALPSGVHQVQVVKVAAGADGLVGWAIAEGEKLETPRKD